MSTEVDFSGLSRVYESDSVDLVSVKKISPYVYIILLPVLMLILAAGFLSTLYVVTGVNSSSLTVALLCVALSEFVLYWVSRKYVFSAETLRSHVIEAVGWSVGKKVVLAVLAALGLQFFNIASNMLLYAVYKEVPKQETAQSFLSANGVDFYVAVLFFVPFLAPLAEELFFRKLLFNVYQKSIPYKSVAGKFVLPAFMSSFIFGLFHAQNTGSPLDFVIVVSAVVSGFTLSYVYCKTGSVKYSFITHCCYNLISVALILATSVL